jgi:hypothetical protein
MREDCGDHLAVPRPSAIIITVLPKPISAAREQGVAWFKRQVGRLE